MDSGEDRGMRRLFALPRAQTRCRFRYTEASQVVELEIWRIAGMFQQSRWEVNNTRRHIVG